MPLSNFIAQAAAIPFASGRICLVNSSSGRGWVIPKGRIEPGETARETALKEAWEEAGLVGILHEDAIGTYCYEKNGAAYRVVVFMMEVTEATSQWPEDHRRTRRWVEPDRVNQLIHVAGMKRVIRRVAALFVRQPTRSIEKFSS